MLREETANPESVVSTSAPPSKGGIAIRILLAIAFAEILVVALIDFQLKIGYNFSFIVFSDVAIAAAGLLIPFFFNIAKLQYWRFLYLVVVFALIEEVVVNSSSFSPFGVALAIWGLISFPALGAALGSRSNDLRIALEVSGLVFAMRVVLAGLPVQILNLGFSLPLSYTLIMIVLASYVVIRKIPTHETKLFVQGSMNVPLQILIGLGVGVGLGLVQYLTIGTTTTSIVGTSLSNGIYVFVTEVVFVAITEEFLFRGLLLNYMTKLVPKWLAVNLSSLIFAIFHIGYLSPPEVLFAYFTGIVLAYLMLRTGSLTSPILAHGIGSVALLSVAPILIHQIGFIM